MRLVMIFAGILQVCAAIPAVNRKACQYPTQKPLDGCPKNTLLVGPGSNFSTIQSAVLSLPNDKNPYNILILPGNYTEQVNITRPGPVYLLGQTAHPETRTKNTVNILWHNATGAGLSTLDNAYTSVLTVAPTFNASLTGTGPTGFPVPPNTPFGNTDFRAYNLNFTNDYLPYSAGPSLAISVSYANTGFYYCAFHSYQDTLYIGKLGNAYIYDSEIAGQTDFLYGFGTAWIQSSLLTLRGCGGGITAWKGTNTTFENRYGVYIHDSELRKENATLAIKGKCALGRPWNALHRSIFADCEMDDSILPAGYIQWNAGDPRIGVNTTMAEYKNYGPGWDEAARRKSNVSVVMGEREYRAYKRVETVFQYPFSGEFGNTAWIDRNPGQ
ncbi:carbohydrate esterase family 8 protein [Bipolaris sorokiniana ND90Pr]|uniref:pectinesterase n=1 Tax=Cochliobolus sativus (strain ND90Pr / ATCC 201652) TaxID=665912 RepID=M2RT13_COCSN|nr:carbohydrate esterase family 8 protein [Bipolaris sorokiniana ND90Pr]EMD69699.1 carbohydrate esterase family 8 protein [Bipolaris sorokiniana ND90Pr]